MAPFSGSSCVVVATQWPVGAATANLMRESCRALAAGASKLAL